MLSSRTILRAYARSPLSASSPIYQPIRCIGTLQSNSHIYIHPSPSNPSTHILSLLPTSPPTSRLAIGTTTTLPPTPSSLAENPSFLSILSSVLAQHATQDPDVRSQAAVLASSSGAFLPGQKRAKTSREEGGAGGASGQGGAGGAGRGGWVHVADGRKAVDFGRIAEPEDIFGSVEVGAGGGFVREEGGMEGNFQWSGTYRVVTREGILGLSDFLRGKLIERLKEEEAKERRS